MKLSAFLENSAFQAGGHLLEDGVRGDALLPPELALRIPKGPKGSLGHINISSHAWDLDGVPRAPGSSRQLRMARVADSTAFLETQGRGSSSRGGNPNGGSINGGDGGANHSGNGNGNNGNAGGGGNGNGNGAPGSGQDAPREVQEELASYDWPFPKDLEMHVHQRHEARGRAARIKQQKLAEEATSKPGIDDQNQQEEDDSPPKQEVPVVATPDSFQNGLPPETNSPYMRLQNPPPPPPDQPTQPQPPPPLSLTQRMDEAAEQKSLEEQLGYHPYPPLPPTLSRSKDPNQDPTTFPEGPWSPKAGSVREIYSQIIWNGHAMPEDEPAPWDFKQLGLEKGPAYASEVSKGYETSRQALNHEWDWVSQKLRDLRAQDGSATWDDVKALMKAEAREKLLQAPNQYELNAMAYEQKIMPRTPLENQTEENSAPPPRDVPNELPDDTPIRDLNTL